jgi:succinoglycan biosynthesis transport protein ExoP
VAVANHETEYFDLHQMVRALVKHRILILGFVLICATVAGIISYITPPLYEAETTIRIKKPKGLTESLLAGSNGAAPLEMQQLMATYSEILKGRTVIKGTIAKVYPVQKLRPDFKTIAKRITTQQVNDTQLLKVTVRSESPRKAARLADGLIEIFVERLRGLAGSEQRAVRDFLRERLGHSKLELQKFEESLESYKKNREIVAPQEETKALVERVSQLNKLVADNQIELATAETKLENINTQLGEEKAEFIADSPVIQNYKTKLAGLEIKLVGLVQEYTDNHPDVVATQAEINATKERMSTEISHFVNFNSPSGNPIYLDLFQKKMATQIELAAAQAQKEEISRILSGTERKILTLPTKERELARLMREAGLSQEIYLMLAKRHEEARISEVMQPTDVQVVEKAVIPDLPVLPKKTKNILMAAALGLFIGIGLAFLLDYLFKTINCARDVKKYLGLPVAGNIPDFKIIKQSKSFRAFKNNLS